MVTKQAAQQAYHVGIQKALREWGFIKTALDPAGWGSRLTELAGKAGWGAAENPVITSALAGGGLGALGSLATRDEGGPFGIGAESRGGAALRGAGIGAGLGALGGLGMKHLVANPALARRGAEAEKSYLQHAMTEGSAEAAENVPRIGSLGQIRQFEDAITNARLLPESAKFQSPSADEIASYLQNAGF